MSDREMTNFLNGVIGVVEANSFERLCLWREYTEDFKKSWASDNCGLGETVGHIGDMPVHISLMKAVVDGHLILFWDATSQVVDHRLIEKWMNDNMPLTAFREGDPRNGVNRVDAMNFCNVFPRERVVA